MLEIFMSMNKSTTDGEFDTIPNEVSKEEPIEDANNTSDRYYKYSQTMNDASDNEVTIVFYLYRSTIKRKINTEVMRIYLKE